MNRSQLKRLHRAVVELDEVTIRSMSPWVPSDDLTFWLGVHKGRAGLAIATPEQRAESLAWLKAHGSGPIPKTWQDMVDDELNRFFGH